MNTTAIALATTGLLTVLAVWIKYLASIPKGNVPARPTGSVLLQIGATGLAVAGIVVNLTGAGATSVAVIAPASFAIIMGTLFLFLLTQRKTPIGDIKVKVGDRLLPFAAQSSDGSPFHTDSLAGRRVLLKFFRGGW